MHSLAIMALLLSQPPRLRLREIRVAAEASGPDTLTVRVRDNSGAPIEGARVFVVPARAEDWTAPGCVCETDSSGTASFGSVPDSSFQAAIEPPEGYFQGYYYLKRVGSHHPDRYPQPMYPSSHYGTSMAEPPALRTPPAAPTSVGFVQCQGLLAKEEQGSRTGSVQVAPPNPSLQRTRYARR